MAANDPPVAGMLVRLLPALVPAWAPVTTFVAGLQSFWRLTLIRHVDGSRTGPPSMAS
jgi:hypothetical protein